MSDRVPEHVTDGAFWCGAKLRSPGPEVLWEGGGYRLIVSGGQHGWQTTWPSGEGWIACMASAPMEELACRLLAERVEQEKLDKHNDEKELKALLEQEVEGICLLGDLEARVKNHQTRQDIQASRLAELDANLAREVERTSRLEAALQVARQAILQLQKCSLERAAPASSGAAAVSPQALRWDRSQGIMVDGKDDIVFDISDYFEDGNMSPADHDLLERLADLWSAWGPEGYLRDRLYDTRYVSVDRFTSGNVRGWFEQLRSELLAKAWRD